MSSGVVVGVDIGTTATKVVAYRVDGAALASVDRSYPLHSPHPGWAEQDPDEVAGAVLDAIAEAVSSVRQDVAAIGLSSVMHSLIGLDGDGRPLTPLITYADTRAWPQALRLRREHGISLYRATGTPIHPMSPLAKLVWFTEHSPELHGRVAHWVSIKEHLLRRMCDSDVVDHAIASATGLFDLSTRDWHPGALQAAGVDPDQLGRPVSTSAVVDGMRSEVAQRLGVPASTPLVVGASDGVLANLGVGAVRPGVAALSIGTSGAIRVTVDAPRTDPDMRTFCYTLSDQQWVVGGAISNGGLVLRWLADELFDGLGGDYDALTAEAAGIPPGSDGVLMLPYLTGERAPSWAPLRGGVLFGLRVGHHRGHTIRACLEGVALQLRLVAAALRDAGGDFDRLRVTGGFVESDLWLQIVADVLNSELEVPQTDEAVAYGAALLAMRGLGLIDDLATATDGIAIARTVVPSADAVAAYDRVAASYAELVERLTPMLRDRSLVTSEQERA